MLGRACSALHRSNAGGPEKFPLTVKNLADRASMSTTPRRPRTAIILTPGVERGQVTSWGGCPQTDFRVVLSAEQGGGIHGQGVFA